jgi:hypothetical protein
MKAAAAANTRESQATTAKASSRNCTRNAALFGAAARGKSKELPRFLHICYRYTATSNARAQHTSLGLGA